MSVVFCVRNKLHDRLREYVSTSHDEENYIVACSWAIANNDVVSTEILLSVVDVNSLVVDQRKFKSSTFLIYAIMYSSYDVFDFLMSHPRIDINMQVPTSGDTALIVACGLGRHMCIRKLLCAKGINVNSQNHQGETALMYAANIGDDVIVRALFGDRHLNKELVNKYGKRAIDIAILRKRKNVIDILKNEN